MTKPSQAELLGYLLEALEPDEQQRIEEQLSRDPRLLEELLALRAGLEVLDDGPRLREPPPGLARRTARFVAREAAAQAEQEAAINRGAAAKAAAAGQPAAKREAMVTPGSRERARGRRSHEADLLAGGGWRFADVATAMAICLAAVALIFPLISVSRANARLTACADKLRQVGTALTQYSEQHQGYFPRVEETGNLSEGGIYAPTLLSEGYVTDPRLFVCPSSNLADETQFRVPSLDELRTASAEVLNRFRPAMGGSFGYALGYRENGTYKPTRNLYRECFALASDAPSKDGSASPNHGWLGHNVLLEDGHLVYLSSCKLGNSSDNMFVNDEGRIAAGCHVNDAVVVRSDVTP